MIQSANIFFRNYLPAVLLLAVTIYSCSKNDGPKYATPVISKTIADTIDVKVGAKASIPLQINAGGGAKSVVVYKKNGFLVETPVAANATAFVYETEALPETMEEGDLLVYEFLVANLDGTDSEKISVVIRAEVYSKITMGTTSLYNIEIPDEGIVSGGTTIKLIKGRNYYLSSSLTFDAGARLQIEEGVHVYMNADADDAINLYVSGEADIKGSASNPVVFTSSKTLLSGATPDAGDWNSFRLNGTGSGSNNGAVDYLRLEYGGDNPFRLSNVGAETAISHVQVFKATSEGVMITNGNARLKYIVATDCFEGSYRLGDSYAGLMQFVISVNSKYFQENDDFAIRETASPVIANATILGPGTGASNTHGIRMRASAAPKMYNCIVSQFPRRGVRVVDNVQVTNLDGLAVFAYSYVFNVPSDPYRDNGVLFAGTFNADGTPLQNTFYNNVLAKTGNNYTLSTITGIGVGDFVPDAETTSAFNPTTLNSFFTAAPFVGAVKNDAEDWTKGWVKNADGTIR
ncbi:MAG TPA: hypothetical protein PKE30_20290 [Niabella sp.]|nr:hypothetical protein [Niabella sp.]